MSRDSVPTPLAVHAHPYPTRFHGGQWTRPVFGMPYVHHVQNHMRELSYADARGGRQTFLGGFGAEPTPLVMETDGVPLIADAPSRDGTEARPVIGRKLVPDAPWGGNNGLFRTHGDGGGIFNRALSGLSGDGVGSLVVFVLGAAAGYGVYRYLSTKK